MLFSGLLLSFFLEYVNPASFVPAFGATKIGTIVPLLVFVFSLTKSEPMNNGKMFSYATSKWMLFLLFLFALSVLIADVTLYSYTVFKTGLINLFWYIMIIKLVTDYNRLTKVFAVLIWSHILLLVLNPDVLLEPETRSYLRGAPFLGDGNDFSFSVCAIWPMCLILIDNARSKVVKMAYLGALVILILSIIATQSRGGSLALAASLGFLWWTSRHKVRNLLLLAILGIGVVSFAAPQYFERMQTITSYQQEQSAMGRITAWKAAVRMAKKYPLTGVGTGHFPVALGREFRPREWGDQNFAWLTAHSMYFLVLGELGLPGIICLMSILVGNYVRLNRLRVRVRGSPHKDGPDFAKLFLMLNAGLVGYCVGGAFLSVAYYPSIYIYSGLIVASMFISEKTRTGAKKTAEVTRLV